MQKTIFWDFDGTLVHPNVCFYDAFEDAAKKHIVPILYVRIFGTYGM